MTRENLNKEKQDEIIREEKIKKAKKITKIILKLSFIFVIVFYVFYLYINMIATSSITIKEKRIIDSKIPVSFNGTKIIHFSDLHYGSNIDNKKLDKIISLINKRNPDLVLFSGDLIAENYNLDSKNQEYLINRLKDIKTTLGKYAVIGDEDADNYTTIMNQSDFIILNNDNDLIYNNTNEFLLLNGISSLNKKKDDVNNSFSYFNMDGANQNVFTISLIHEPDLSDKVINTHKSDLILAGHSHNGNIRIPFLGSISKKDGAKKYDQEYYDISNTDLYISSGLGTEGDGIRLFCRPSINFFRLSNS